MFHMKYLFYFILLHLIIATPQLNLYYIDRVSENDNALQHDCFRIAGNVKYPNASRKIISYCMSELSSTFHIETNNEFSKFTFTELSKRNINSQQSSIHSRRSYNEILREQFLQHKHLLTAPVILVILTVPHLIITFISKCMKSTNDSWLFLIGYFISFIPPMVTFLVFIVPSKFYKKQFRKSVDHYRTILQRQLHLTS